jgi:hypothetical protein
MNDLHTALRTKEQADGSPAGSYKVTSTRR